MKNIIREMIDKVSELNQSLDENRNVKTVKIFIPNEFILKRIMTTPTLSRLTKLNPKVGENIERVNHYQFNALMQMYPIVGASVEEMI
jgi:hypothetical protein